MLGVSVQVQDKDGSTATERLRVVRDDAMPPNPLYAIRPLSWFLKRLVKIAFRSDGGIFELMWVRVKGARKGRLVGELDNVPQLVTNIQRGDKVTLSRKDILAVDLSLEEWCAECDVLTAYVDSSNPTLGEPKGAEFLMGHTEGLTPREALIRWRTWKPQEKESDSVPTA